MNSHFHTPPERIASLHAIRDRHKGQACTTQKARLLDALQTLGHVTTFEAMRYLDIYDPRPRKLALLKDGYRVVTTRRRLETESGEPHRIGVYWLQRGGDSGHPPDTPNDEAPTVASGQGFSELRRLEEADFSLIRACSQAAQIPLFNPLGGRP